MAEWSVSLEGLREMKRPVTVTDNGTTMAVKFGNLLCDPSAPGEHHEDEDDET